MRNLADLDLVSVWVNPGHLASSALHLMKGHGLKSLAVMEQGRLLGVVTQDMVASAPEKAEIGLIMRKSIPTIDPETMVVKAAQMFVEDGWDVAAVANDHRFYGLVSATTLLGELRRSWDPLTGLGWSDRLREWGVDNLANGREITILFIDLDDFGRYNKLYGHLVGDRVLRKVATHLKDSIDNELDILVRYGGDEFAIGTLRNRAAAEDLAMLIKERSGAMFVEEAFRPVTFSVGLAGGRRSIIRPDIHVGATYDELVNSASRDALARKPKRLEAEFPRES